MEEEQARLLAELIGGEPWQSGGDVWLVCKQRSDGKLVAISDEVVSEYADWAELSGGQPLHSIVLV